MAEASTARGPERLWEALHAVLPLRRNRHFRVQPLPRLINEQGVPATPLAERGAIWQRHFCELEAGEVATTGVLAQACAARQAAATGAQPDVLDLVAADVLDLGQWHAALLTGQAGRATGPDAIPAEAYRTDPFTMARASYPLTFKIVATAKEPFQHKGGILQPLWKGQGQHSTTSSYRDVLLSDVLGKRLHAGLRKQVMAAAAAGVRATQCGGVPGKGADMCALTVREFMAAAARDHMSSAVLFADLRSAYYRAVRETVVGGELHTDVLLNIAARLGVEREAMQPLLDALHGASLLEQAGVRPHMLRVLRDMHRDTWFGIVGCDSAVGTRLGTRPGDPFGDMLFLYLVAARLSELEKRLSDAGVAVTVSWSGARTLARRPPSPEHAVGLCDVSFADDFAILLLGRSPRECVEHLRQAAASTADVFEEWGAELNTAKGKSAGMLALRGAGTHEERERIWIAGAGVLECPRERRPPLRLPLVHRYKHMGGIVTVSGDMLPEVRERAGQCADALRTLRGPVLRNPGVSLKARDAIGASLAGSGLVYNAQAWTPLGALALAAFETAHMRVLREVAGLQDHREGMATDAAVVAAIPAHTAAEVLAAARLRCLPRLLEYGPPVLLALLSGGSAESPSQWKGALAADLAWLSRSFTCAAALQPG